MSAEALTVEPKFNQAQHQEQLRYDLQTQFAELVDGSMRTEFELKFNGYDLMGEEGRSMGQVTKDALSDAKEIAKANPSLWFEVRRRGFEREEFHELIEMARGERPNTMIVVSDFPPELAEAKKDIGGYNVTRKQTMLRVLVRKPDGNIQMYSQSLDGSSREALEAIYSRFGIEPDKGELLGQRININLPWAEQETLASELTGIYDRSLTQKFGGKWHAGRRPADYRNTYEFVCHQQDLITECVRLDGLGWLNRSVMYDTAATMDKRFKTEKQGLPTTIFRSSAVSPALLHQEMKQAGDEARQIGKSFSACGDTLFEQAGYENKAGHDEFGSLKFKCTEGHDNVRPHGKLIDKCQHKGCKGKVCR